MSPSPLLLFGLALLQLFPTARLQELRILFRITVFRHTRRRNLGDRDYHSSSSRPKWHDKVNLTTGSELSELGLAVQDRMKPCQRKVNMMLLNVGRVYCMEVSSGAPMDDSLCHDCRERALQKYYVQDGWGRADTERRFAWVVTVIVEECVRIVLMVDVTADHDHHGEETGMGMMEIEVTLRNIVVLNV